MSKQDPFVANGVPVQFRGEKLPSVDKLLYLLKESLGETFVVDSGMQGKVTSKKFKMAQIFGAWSESSKRLLLKHELTNIVQGRADYFVDKFKFDCIDEMNALDSDRQVRTITLSPRGALTGTHHDPEDGLAYYFTGCKLWFFMDRVEAARFPGLPNLAEHKYELEESKTFSLSDFLKMTRSWWVLTVPGDIVRVPLGMLHRVLTVEATLGLCLNFSSSSMG